MRNPVILLLAFVLLAGFAFAGISVTNYTVSQTTFKPGANGVMSLVVSNPQAVSGTTYRMTGVSLSVYSPPEFTVSAPSNIGDIEAGGSTIVAIPFKIRSDAKSGVYVIEFRLTGFSSASSTAAQDVYSKSVTVPVTVVNVPILTLTSSQEVIGGTEPVTITIINDGGTANDLRLAINATSEVALYSASMVYIGDVADKKDVNIVLDARSAADGPANVPFTLTYSDEVGTSHTDIANLRLTVKNEQLDLRFNQVSALTTRKESTLSLEVVNNGDSLSDVRLSFLNSSVRLKDKNEIKLGDLAPGGKASVSDLVYTELAPGLNIISATVTWTEKDVRKEEEVSIPIIIASDADVSVYLESKPTPLTANTEHTISVLVSNIGSYSIDNVDVGVNSTGFDLLDVTPRQYIGSLAKDDFSTVQFKIKTKASAGTYPITINVRYRDASGEWVNKDLGQSAVVYALPVNGSGSTVMLFGAALLIAVALWWFKFRKKG